MFGTIDRPDWTRDATDWPNRPASRRVRAAGLDWHVQVMGEGPDVLLLHGTGASTHSWRDVAPILAQRYRVIVPDLPGHGFTGMPKAQGLTLRGMADAVATLMQVLDARPVAGIGHSAGAAVLVAMELAKPGSLFAIVSVNGALLPIRHAGLFAPLARLLFVNPLAPRLFAMRAGSRSAVTRLIEGTGSHLNARGIDLYSRLLRRPGHIEGALGMMANWDLDWLKAKIGQLEIPLSLVVAKGDRAIPSADAGAITRLCPVARIVDVDRGGHLAHEEFPDMMAGVILECLDLSLMDRRFANSHDMA